jgi:uncharacterized protein YheU (UPF0270 family)
MTEEAADRIEVPHAQLSHEALRGVVESFVLREGTDYGVREFTLEEKVQHVMLQLQRGEARIVFDPHSETVQILAR